MDRFRNDWPSKGEFSPTIVAIGRAGVQLWPRSVDFAWIRESSWLSYQVAYASPWGPTATWQPMPEITLFWLSGLGVLSPGAKPPQVFPPSFEVMTTICWVGAVAPS